MGNVKEGEQESWRIILAEKPLKLGKVDNFFLGNDACHSFLVLENAEGEIASEIHGMAYHPKKERIAYTTLSPGVIAGSIAYSLNLSKAFNHFFGDNAPKLKAVISQGEWKGGGIEDSNKRILREGPKEEILKHWVAGSKAALEINRADMDYIPISVRACGQNCNSVTSWVSHAMGLDKRDIAFNMAAVGYSNRGHFIQPSLFRRPIIGATDFHEMLKIFDGVVRDPENYFWRTNDGIRMTSMRAATGDPLAVHVA